MSAARRFDRAEWALAMALTGLAVFLHVQVWTHAGPLWRDEANTVAVASRAGLSGVVAALEHESFPLLPFATVRAWAALGLGGTDARLRLLGFGVGLGMLAAIWWNRTRIRGAPPLVALALFALNPVVVRWGDSLRGYGAGALFAVLAFGCLFRLSVCPGVANFAGAAAAAILAVQCVYQNALLLAAMCAGGCAVAARRRQWRAAALSAGVGALAALSLVPYAPIIARAREHFVVITLDANFSRIWSAFREALGSPERPGGPGAAAGAAVLGVWAVAFALAAFAGLRALLTRPSSTPEPAAGDAPRRDLALYSLAVAVVAPVLFFAFVYRLRFLTEPWYFIVFLAVEAAAIDAAASGLEPARWFRGARLALCAGVVLVALPPAFATFGQRQTNIDLIARQVSREAAPGDLVLVNPWFYGVSFGRYFRGATPWVHVPILADREIHRFDLLKEQMMRTDPLSPLRDRIAETLRGGHRVWIVGALAVPPKGQAPPHLPPASDARGWYSAPYLGAWSQEVGFFLQTRGKAGRRVPVPGEGPVGKYENLSLFVVEGWRG